MLTLNNLLQEIILVEGLKLDGVPAGLYSVHCLHLRLLGAEGSPIRCILVKWYIVHVSVCYCQFIDPLQLMIPLFSKISNVCPGCNGNIYVILLRINLNGKLNINWLFCSNPMTVSWAIEWGKALGIMEHRNPVELFILVKVGVRMFIIHYNTGHDCHIIVAFSTKFH